MQFRYLSSKSGIELEFTGILDSEHLSTEDPGRNAV